MSSIRSKRIERIEMGSMKGNCHLSTLISMSMSMLMLALVSWLMRMVQASLGRNRLSMKRETLREEMEDEESMVEYPLDSPRLVSSSPLVSL